MYNSSSDIVKGKIVSVPWMREHKVPRSMSRYQMVMNGHIHTLVAFM
jgi:hypothetical protein